MKFVSIDIDNSRDIAIKYDVKSVPTFIIIKNRKIINRFTGGDIEQLTQQLNQY